MEWKDFLASVATKYQLTPDQRATLVIRFDQRNDDKSNIQTANDDLLHISESDIKKRLGEIYKIFESTCPNLANPIRGKREILRKWLLEAYEKQKNQPPQPEIVGIPNNLNQCYSGTPNFVGRISDRAWLDQEIQKPSQQPVIVALAGMGGVGKTELAIQYARQNLNDYQGGVCWILAREFAITPQIVSFAITQFNLHIPDGFDLPQQLDFCWRRWREGNVLLVLDDVADYAQVKPYLPPDKRFKVLITTRWAMDPPVVSRSLGVLEKNEALELLGSPEFVGECRLGLEESTAERLCEWLGYLPLGLELVGRYLAKKQDLNLSEMLERLEDKSLDARALLKPEAEMTAQRGVAAAFELSWAELEEDPRLLCCLLGIFALAPIPWKLVEQCLPEQDREDLEDYRDEELLGRSLLEWVGEKRYQLHQLIREFFVIKLQQECLVDAANKLKKSFAETLTAEAKTIGQTLTQTDITRVADTLPHLEIVANNLTHLLEDYDKDCSLNGLARVAQFQSRWQDTERWYKKSLEISETNLGANHPYTTTSLSNLGLLYNSMGRYSEAEPLLVQSLQIWETHAGANHFYTTESLNNLGLLYNSMGRYSEAELLYVRSLHIRESHLGADHLDTATSLNNLALLYYSMGCYSKAEPLCVQSLHINETQLGADHPYTAGSLNNLAELYRIMGRYSEAEPLLVRSLHIHQTQLGADHPSTATSLNNLAGLYKSMGRYSEAEPLYVRSLHISETRLGVKHPDTAQSLHNLAALYGSMGRYSDAEPLYERSLHIRETHLGEDHPYTANSINGLAKLYESMGRYSDAEPLYIRTLEILVKSLPEDHPYIQTTWGNFFYLLQQALANGRTAELSNHPITQQLLQELRNN